jgi:hypothetical protein
VANPRTTYSYGDSKGRSPREPGPPDIVALHEKDCSVGLENCGDYYWFDFYGSPGGITFEGIALNCPFCNFNGPIPTLTKVEKKNPLTLTEELTCGHCSCSFHVIEGKAIRSWGRISIGGMV